MATDFRMRALDAGGQVRTLRLQALDERDAREQAAQQGFTPLGVKAVHWQARRRAVFPGLLFAQQLHALLAAGLGVVEALDALQEREDAPHVRAVIARLLRDVQHGERLSDALARQPDSFTPLFAGIVQAAEGTSELPASLARYVDYESRLEALRHKVLSAILYPCILLVVGSAVSLFLLGYVVPRFATVYVDSGRPLPWASALLLDWGRLVAGHANVLVPGFVAVVGATLAWARAQWQGGGWSLALAWLPTARPHIEIMELSRVYLTLGMLLEGGIPMTRALRMAGSVLPPKRRARLEAACRQVENGDPLSVALAHAGLSTPVAARLLRVGERSGQLGRMLVRGASFHESETARWLERFSRTFEPVLMAAIGLVIGAIVILLYMPVFDLAGSLG